MTTQRRTDALSRERIVAAAVELLDVDGENGLTFRRLAEHLTTGPGAIYNHVANKSELLVAATDAVLAPAMTAGVADDVAAADAVRAVALIVFDTIDVHPWVGTQLSSVPSHPAMLRILEPIGRQIQALDVPEADQFASVSALLAYILGVSGQNAANARMLPGVDRTDFLTTVSAGWANLDPGEYPFARHIARQLPGHDDREQFLAGIDLILTGIRMLGRASRSS
jgi:AcrR family transcriptional regulator